MRTVYACFIVMLIGGVTCLTPWVFANVPFTDTSGHWAKTAMDIAVQKGYVDGYDDAAFHPDKPVSRAEFVKMAVTALKLQFDGLKEGQLWYEPYVQAAARTGIHRYADFKTGDWNTPMSRLEMVRVAVRAVDPRLLQPNVLMDDMAFMYNATKKGLIQGLAGGELGKELNTTRAQSVTIIERMLTLQSGGVLEVDKAAVGYAEVEMTGSNVNTMWGLKAKPLPMELDLDSRVKVTLDRLLVVDMGDPDGAFRTMFPAVMKTNGEMVAKDEYVVAMHFHVSNDEYTGEGMYLHDFTIGAFSGLFIRAHVLKEDQTPKTTNPVPVLFLNEHRKVEGWYLMTISKQLYEEKKRNNQFWGVLMVKENSGDDPIRLAE